MTKQKTAALAGRGVLYTWYVYFRSTRYTIFVFGFHIFSILRRIGKHKKLQAHHTNSNVIVRGGARTKQTFGERNHCCPQFCSLCFLTYVLLTSRASKRLLLFRDNKSRARWLCAPIGRCPPDAILPHGLSLEGKPLKAPRRTQGWTAWYQ